MAMGNAQVASANDGYGMYYNPAALPNLQKKQFLASYSSMSLDRQFNYIGFALPLRGIAGASAGWINSGVNDLRSYNSIGEDTGQINHGLNAIYFSFAAKIIALAQADKALMSLPSDLINIGVTAKFIREDIDDDADFDYKGQGFGIDLGVLIKLHQDWRIGYQLKDLNANLRSNTDDIFERGSQLDNDFPLTQKAGVFYKTPFSWLVVAYDFEWSNKGEERHHIGTELTADGVAGRIGYDNDRFTVGGGIKFQTFKETYMSLDYAFMDDVVDEGISHVFSWRFLF
ncbi:MAG: hypothetical protein GWN16_11910 [Calditrichae bacterium]|nr:hypothetical protein [Calditrichia bacterium]